MRLDRASQTIGTTHYGGMDVTLIWFVIWLVSDLIGDRESLTFDPVNAWAATLILVIALDLGRQHAPTVGKRS
jgi:hypothetical protein